MNAPLRTRVRALRRRRAEGRGFTLLELLVAVVAGLFVVMAAFLLARGSTSLFGSENNAGTAQLNLRLGLDRLRSDISRAGYMTTPNVALDPDVCPRPSPMIRLQSIYLQQGGSYVDTKAGSDLNGLNPDSIIVTGNFSGTDQYLVSSVEPGGASGAIVYLQRNFGAVQRLLTTAGGDGGGAGVALSTQNVLDATFPKGKYLRIVNPLGASQFMIINGASMTTLSGSGALVPTVQIAAMPVAVDPANPNKRCGISGYGLGSTVNTVDFVRYSLRNLSALAPWAYSSPVGDSGAGQPEKYDLVRSEVKADGSDDVPTGTATGPVPMQIVAEYVVDMKFAFTTDSGTVTTGAFREPKLVVYPFDDPTGVALAGDVTPAGSTAAPQRIRSVRYQITTRTAYADRSDPIGEAGSGLLRYRMPPLGAFYARARTDVGEITLLNQRGVTW